MSLFALTYLHVPGIITPTLMSNKQEKEIVQATVTEALPNTMFRVRLKEPNAEGEHEEMIAYLAGRMKLYRIKVLIGDTVEVLLDPYGGKGRVVKRL